MFRVCALFCLRIASPLLYQYYPHVLSISCNCLAPPHFPESPHIMFYPSVHLKFTHSLNLREFVFFDSVLYSCCYSCPEIPVLECLPSSCFLFPAVCFLSSGYICTSCGVFICLYLYYLLLPLLCQRSVLCLLCYVIGSLGFDFISVYSLTTLFALRFWYFSFHLITWL